MISFTARMKIQIALSTITFTTVITATDNGFIDEEKYDEDNTTLQTIMLFTYIYIYIYI